MTTQHSNLNSTDSSPVFKFKQQREILEKIPELSRSGFSQVADHTGSFSVGFASGVTQAFTVREQLAVDKNDLGIKPLREDYRRINQEINTVFQDITKLIEEKTTVKEQIHQLTVWALDLEQDTFLPAVVDQIKRHCSNELEQQTLGSIIDSLMRQVRTLIREIILSTQESADLLDSLSRRLSADLETSKHNFSTLKSRSTTLMKKMTDKIKAMDLCCESMESHTTQVNGIIFEMVQAIQYDDITAQRLDHTMQTLERVDERFNKPEMDTMDKRWAAIATNIAMEQLEEISTDLVTAVQSLHQHLTNIETVANERKNTAISARDTGMACHQNALDLSYHLGALLRLSIFDDDFSSELLRNFSKTENALFQTKRAFEMLNLTAQRLEKLLVTLDCKSNRRTKTLSDTIGQLVERIQKEGSRRSLRLIEATNQLQDISLSYSEKSTPKIMRVITLLRRVPLRSQQVESDHNGVLKTFGETIGDTQAMVAQIKLLAADMDFHNQVRGSIEHIIQSVTELLPKIVGLEVTNNLQGNISNLAGEFSDLSSLYTMASERKAHGNVLGKEPLAQEETSDDDDGFELF